MTLSIIRDKLTTPSPKDPSASSCYVLFAYADSKTDEGVKTIVYGQNLSNGNNVP
jgi:hypothetical protein